MMTRNNTLHYVKILVVVIILASLLKIFVLDAVMVPSRSMEPAVRPGDFLLLDKTGYAPWFVSFRTPDRGEVVALTLPGGLEGSADDTGALILKRCVAIPGDTLDFRDGTLMVNGHAAAAGVADGGPFFIDGRPRPVPRRGDVLPLDSAHCALWRDLITMEGHEVGEAQGGRMTIDGAPAATYTVEKDYMFVQGDNHAVSLDSRRWGYLPVASVIGKAVLVYWSLDAEGSVRWNRIGTLVE